MAEREIAANWEGSELSRGSQDSLLARSARPSFGASRSPGSRDSRQHRSPLRHAVGRWLLDAKAHSGRLECRDSGQLFRPRNELYVAGRNRTTLVKGVEKQIECVLAALRLVPEAKGTPVHGALCFVTAEWKLLDFAFQVDGVWVLHPGALRKWLKKQAPLSARRDESSWRMRSGASSSPPRRTLRNACSSTASRDLDRGKSRLEACSRRLTNSCNHRRGSRNPRLLRYPKATSQRSRFTLELRWSTSRKPIF